VKVGEYVAGFGPVVRLVIEGPHGSQTIETRIDTGFYGMLTLPTPTVDALGLTFSHRVEVTLADGQGLNLNVHRARAEWLGASVPIFVHAIPTRPGHRHNPLLGLRMFDGHTLKIEVIPEGDVTVEPVV
jgi:clan AA aspartic protease